MFKSLVICLVIPLLLVGCVPTQEQQMIQYKFKRICNEGMSENLAKFTLECIKNANPMSDEEPEDWIHKCESLAEIMFCPLMKVKQTQAKGGKYKTDVWRIVHNEVVGPAYELPK